MPRGRRRVTMTDVARRAGVSQPTVSVVLNRTPNSRVADETVERIWQAAHELGYRPDYTAQGLRRGTTQMIGFVTDAVATTPFAGEVIKGAQQIAYNQKYLLLVVNSEGKPSVEDEAVEVMLQHRVTGILYSSWHYHEIIPPEALYDIPSVLINCFVADGSLPSIVPDERRGGREATRILLDHGHVRIACINSVPVSAESEAYGTAGTTGGPRQAPATTERLAGYRDVLTEAGIPLDPALIHEAEPVQEGGYEAMSRLLDMPEPPTAVFCYNDRVAMGAYDAIHERGLTIPDDIAVIGFDNQEIISAHLRPPLSTMALPHLAMGRRGAEYLLDRMNTEEPAEPYSEQLHCEFIARQSI